MKKKMQIDKLRIKIYPTREEMGIDVAQEAIEYINAQLETKSELNIIFAAAPSQNDLLKELDRADVEWGSVNAFHMDEYVGLAVDAPQCFRSYLDRHIFSRFPFKSVNYILTTEEKPEIICQKYVDLLTKYPIDIVFMGIGENGHIAFNDPHVALFNDTESVKIVELDQMCRNQQVNDGCFLSIDAVPTHAITLTIPMLLSADKIFCVAPTAAKANAIEAVCCGEITEQCPASILRQHKDATLYCDNDSAKKIL